MFEERLPPELFLKKGYREEPFLKKVPRGTNFEKRKAPRELFWKKGVPKRTVLEKRVGETWAQ